MIEGERLTLRPAGDEDAPALAAILAAPEAARWWGRYDEARVREDLRDEVTFAVVLGDGEVAGWLHVNEETDPDHRFVGFDIVLAEALCGRGYGREVLRTAIDHYVAGGHHRFTIDPAADNERAIRCYTAVGFRPVGTLRAYERDLDGEWRDGLLMELVVTRRGAARSSR